jgi:hypothetical protein
MNEVVINRIRIRHRGHIVIAMILTVIEPFFTIVLVAGIRWHVILGMEVSVGQDIYFFWLAILRTIISNLFSVGTVIAIFKVAAKYLSGEMGHTGVH